MPHASEIWLRRWLYALNIVILAAGLVLVSTSTRRGWFLVLSVPIAFAPFCYARWRTHRSLQRRLGEQRWVLVALSAFVAVGAVCDAVMLAQLLTARSAAPPPLLHSAVVGWIGAVWFSSHVLFLIGLALVVPLRRLGRWAQPQHDPQRRQALQQMGAVGVGVPFAISLSGVSLSYDFRVEEYEIFLPDWPRQLDGMRVAHLSDIHVGGAMNRERLKRVAELTNAARPELVLHTGDFLTHRVGDFDLPLYEALSRIKAPLGQWACLGNHDFDNADQLVQRLHGAGVTTLRNRLTTLTLQGEKVELGGLDYQWPRLDRTDAYARLLASLGERSAVRLLLNHDPSTFGTLPAGCADLVCSGHTHGGHIGVQLGKDSAITVVGMIGIPDQGLFERDAMRLFVTRCVGFYGYPMRLGIPPEISLLVLRRAV